MGIFHCTSARFSLGVSLFFLLSAASYADTNTPFAAGDSVVVQLTSSSLSGTLESSSRPGWVSIREAKSGNSVAIPIPAIQSLQKASTEAAQPSVLHAAAPELQNSHKYVVYVHGICQHAAGYSDPWWSAMKNYVDVPPANRREVLWSDLVNPEHAHGASPLAESAPSPQKQNTARQIKDTLRDRAERQRVQTFGTQSVMGPEHQQLVDEIPGINCVDDFVDYMLQPTLRAKVLDRFDEKIKPLLQEDGAQIEVISHSWGTVVAYEALCRLESPSPPKGAVHNLFTVGSALSIAEVRANLLQQSHDLHRPNFVKRWSNLDAKFDVVGGYVPGEVDEQDLDLQPIGCSFIPNPTCSHSSYFDPLNLRVNRDIFGRAIMLP